MQATTDLRTEHVAVLRMLDVLDVLGERARSGEQDDAPDLAECVDFLHVFVDRCHHGKEEELLFPAMRAEAKLLRPHLPRALAPVIAAYVALVSAMVVLAWASFAAGGPLAAALGATAFYLSDLGVARERFVAPDGRDKLWALPLYYVGQVLIALSA